MYHPPPLTRRIILRDPRDRPDTETDGSGHELPVREWGRRLWAARRDRRPFDEIAEGIQTRGAQTVFTIRKRQVPADFSVVYDGLEYVSAGAPVLRGGAEGGRRTEYLELWCERRAVDRPEVVSHGPIAFSAGFSGGFR